MCRFYTASAALVAQGADIFLNRPNGAPRALRSVGWQRGGPPRYWLANRFPCTTRLIGQPVDQNIQNRTFLAPEAIKRLREEPDEEHAFAIERIEDDWCVTLDHPMTKDH